MCCILRVLYTQVREGCIPRCSIPSCEKGVVFLAAHVARYMPTVLSILGQICVQVAVRLRACVCNSTFPLDATMLSSRQFYLLVGSPPPSHNAKKIKAGTFGTKVAPFPYFI